MAMRNAVRAASNDFIFTQTVDWSYDLRQLRIFLELLKHFDVVQGVRPTPIRLISYIPVVRSIWRIRSRSDNLRKAVVSLSNYYLIKLLYGVPFRDFQNLNFYPRELAQAQTLEANSAFSNPELLIKCTAAGARVIEVPIRFFPRQLGEAKGTSIRSIRRALFDVLGNWWRWGRSLPRVDGRDGRGQIFRVSEPFDLEPEVTQLVAPLFPDFR